MAKKQNDEATRDDENLEDTGSRVYELGFHINPELPSEEVKKAYQAVRELIAGKGAVVAEGEPQKLQLAYTVSRSETAGRRDFDSAYFSWIAYETSAANHADILDAAKADTRIIRFIDVLTTKDAARHAVEMRELSAKAPERADEPPAPADELDAAIERTAV
ncbi:MAG TPA: 30S ribosomal protein S6 [Candidatus Paceibacterota bacterium]|nr:30S ribosomal protein S6 [Candidatus Paceibacterota bacterium]